MSPSDLKQEQIELVAAKIGLHSVPWTLGYRPYVQWPKDYDEAEKKRFRECAVDILIGLATK